MKKATTVWNGTNYVRKIVTMTDDEVAEHSKRPPVTVDQVNAEAQRRIFEAMPQHVQANTTAAAALLAIKGQANWTAEDLAAYEQGLAGLMAIRQLRDLSNVLTEMDPIPQDYENDKWWSPRG